MSRFSIFIVIAVSVFFSAALSAQCTGLLSFRVAGSSNGSSVTAYAGEDITLGSATFTMAASAASSGTGTWTLISGTATITNPNAANTTVTGVPNSTTATLRWTVVSGSCTRFDDIVLRNSSVLPIELLSFNAQHQSPNNYLTWATSSEKDNAGFYIERSSDGRVFESLGFVKGAGTTNEKKSYDFTDATPLSISYYRLRQVDLNGVTTYSKMISVSLLKLGRFTIKPYPNPTHDRIGVEQFNNFKTLNIYNLAGVLMLTARETEVNIAGFAAGTYILEVENKEGEKARAKFIKD
jgi:Secretion system C-terminal sorting domain